jgi:hypothetical protein
MTNLTLQQPQCVCTLNSVTFSNLQDKISRSYSTVNMAADTQVIRAQGTSVVFGGRKSHTLCNSRRNWPWSRVLGAAVKAADRRLVRHVARNFEGGVTSLQSMFAGQDKWNSTNFVETPRDQEMQPIRINLMEYIVLVENGTWISDPRIQNFPPMPRHVPYGLRGLPFRLRPKCNRFLRLGRPCRRIYVVPMRWMAIHED